MASTKSSKSMKAMRRRNRLRQRANHRLTLLRDAHHERADHAARVADATARRLVADFKRRDELSGVPGEAEVRALIDLRGRLRDAVEARDRVGARLALLQQEHRMLSRSEPATSSKEVTARLAKLNEEGEASDAEFVRLRRKALLLEREFEERAEKAGCTPALYSTELEEDLQLALSGKRRRREPRWDVSQEIFRHYVSNLTPHGIEDASTRLDDPDDAMAFSLVARALLSEDADDNLIASAVANLEDEWLLARKDPESMELGQSLLKFTARMLTPRRRKKERGERVPLRREDIKPMAIEARDERLRWFVLAAEEALCAVTGEDLPAAPRKVAATASVAGPRRTKRMSARGGRPTKYPPKADKKLYSDYRSAGMSKALFEKSRGLEPGSIEAARSRIKERETRRKKEPGRNPRKKG